MDKSIDSSTISAEHAETLQALSQTGTNSEVGTDEGPENDSDYDLQKQNELELSSRSSGEESRKHDDGIENELKGEKLDDISYCSSSEDEEEVEDFEKNIKSLSLSDELNLKDALNSESNELQGVSKEEYLLTVGELNFVDEESFVIHDSRHRKIRMPIKNKLLENEKSIQQKQERKVDQSHPKQINQEKKNQLNEQRLREENSKENEVHLKYEKERQSQLEKEKKLKDQQLRQDQKLESQKLSQKEQLQREGQSRNRKEIQLQNQGQLYQSPFLQSQPLQPRQNSSQMQRSFHENIFKPVIKSQNEQTLPITPSLSIKSFHLPDLSLSHQSDVRNFRQMNVKGPVSALRTLTDNYRQLELDKQNADIKVRQLELDKQTADGKVDQLEKQLEQYRQLLRKEQSNNNKHSEIETITCGVGDDFKKSSSHGKFPLTEKEILLYFSTYARKAEDERDEAKKALVKTQQDIAQMNDQFESLRASAQIPNKRTQLSSIAIPTQPISLASSELPMKPFEETNGLLNVNNIKVQENNQIIEPKEIGRDSGSEKNKSRENVDPEQIRTIQEEIESRRIDRENLRKKRQAMEKKHRRKTVPKSEITSKEENESVEGREDGRKTDRYGGLHRFVNGEEDLQNYEDSCKNKKRPTNHNEDCYIGSREQLYNEYLKAFNKRTANKMQFTGYNEGEQYYEHYDEDEPHENLPSESSELNQYIDPREQQYYYEKREDQKRDNLYMKEDPDIHPSDLRLSPTRGGRIYSHESPDSAYIHIKGRKQYVRHAYDDFEEESDYIRDCGYREELKRDDLSIDSQQDYPVWKDIKNGKSYLRKRDYIIQEPASKPMRSGDIPFILGTGTGKSHSVTVNLQKAFALLKNHSSNSCSVCNKKNTKNAANKNKFKKSSSENEESPDIALGRVIGNLMDELKHLKMHYGNLVIEYQKIDPLDSKSKRSALAEELKEIMDQMEIKGDQIATLYDIQQKTVKPSLRYGFTQKNNYQKPTRSIHETRPRVTRKVQKPLNDL
ncbi:hypothetical protein GLOIN_2v500423 [Rhizophagus clarus]|uniref:Cep57 centrosome microtubule-binding domain-containing protein n=1 Tax=Rhizophagus clarus TaxID=94130 RepID=A0A8H3QU66_9GLOM|nr:hypothetical protein GLOIN_2v500423 [Rhizophagus clarus]